jgi:hypothetical protein
MKREQIAKSTRIPASSIFRIPSGIHGAFGKMPKYTGLKDTEKQYLEKSLELASTPQTAVTRHAINSSRNARLDFAASWLAYPRHFSS